MPVINFVKEKKKVEVPAGSNLRAEAMKAGVQVYSGVHTVLHCPGIGQCGSCKVLITKGADRNVKKQSLYEKIRMFLGPLLFFARLGREEELRLSCQTTVTGDIDVETHPGVNWHGEKYWG